MIPIVSKDTEPILSDVLNRAAKSKLTPDLTKNNRSIGGLK